MKYEDVENVKVGDTVRVKSDEYVVQGEMIPESNLLVVEDDSVDKETPGYRINTNKVELRLISDFPEDFEKVVDCYFSGGLMGEAGSERIIPLTREETNLGVYRPILEDRKVGKVRVELVDDGFPLALREIAKVMTWAQTAKGYKDHDWQNLPNAEVSLAAAASRHRTDHIMQRVFEGLNIDQCVDHESKLLHKAHEAFGVLAQLELMLRGKFE